MLSVLEATSLVLALAPDRLVLTANDSGDDLEFIASRPLEGTTWLLTRLAGADRPTTSITLRLEDGSAAGEGPCGPYAAAYASDGLFISFSEVRGSDAESCSAAQIQRRLLDALRGAVMVDRRGGQLRFVDARGKVTARFKAPTGP